MNSVNERIMMLRQYRGYSEEEMASRLNINVSNYKMYEKNYKFNVIELCSVADVLDVSMDYLIGRIDIPVPVITEQNLKEVVEYLKELRK